VFLNFRQVKDTLEFPYAKLASRLQGKGVPNIESALWKIKLEPLHEALAQWIFAFPFEKQDFSPLDFQKIGEKASSFFYTLRELVHAVFSPEELAQEVRRKSELIFSNAFPWQKIWDFFYADSNRWKIMLSWILFSPLWEKKISLNGEATPFSLFTFLFDAYQNFGMNSAEAKKSVLVFQWMMHHEKWYETETVETIFENLLSDPLVREFLHVHRDQEVNCFHKESFEEMLQWLYVLAVLSLRAKSKRSISTEMRRVHRMLRILEKAGQKSGYQIEKWREEIFKVKYKKI